MINRETDFINVVLGGEDRQGCRRLPEMTKTVRDVKDRQGYQTPEGMVKIIGHASSIG